jgi:hypothetical protein
MQNKKELLALFRCVGERLSDLKDYDIAWSIFNTAVALSLSKSMVGVRLSQELGAWYLYPIPST